MRILWPFQEGPQTSLGGFMMETMAHPEMSLLGLSSAQTPHSLHARMSGLPISEAPFLNVDLTLQPLPSAPGQVLPGICTRPLELVDLLDLSISTHGLNNSTAGELLPYT